MELTIYKKFQPVTFHVQGYVMVIVIYTLQVKSTFIKQMAIFLQNLRPVAGY